MKKILLMSIISLMTAPSISLATTRAYCADVINLNEKAVKIAESSVETGEMPITDLLQVKIGLADARLLCYAITRDTYCDLVLEMQESIVESKQDEVLAGMDALNSLVAAQTKLAEVRNLCL